MKSTVDHVCNWTAVVEAGESWIPSQPGIHSVTLFQEKKKIWKKQKRDDNVPRGKEKGNSRICTGGKGTIGKVMSPYSSWSRTRQSWSYSWQRGWLASALDEMCSLSNTDRKSACYIFHFQFLFQYANCPISFIFYMKVWLPNHTAVSY